MTKRRSIAVELQEDETNYPAPSRFLYYVDDVPYDSKTEALQAIVGRACGLLGFDGKGDLER